MLDKKYNFSECEPKWQKYWEDNEIYKFDANSEKRYMIDTPPPTVSGNIHLGHVFSYVQVDVIARHQRMLGNSVFYPFGYDDNGLPTEHYVQKNSKVKLNELNREEFNELCTKVSDEMEPVYREIFSKAGLSANFNNTYKTISKNTQKISQTSFIKLYEKGAVVRKNAASLWCPNCRTAIAQSETETVEIPSKMNYIYFTVKETGEKLHIATTRPELLCACVCVFVHPDDKNRIGLVGKTAISPIYNREVPILSNSDVVMDKGTGAVMCCTFGDEADAKWQNEFNLPALEGIAYNGRMTALAGEFEGMKVAEAREAIIEKLREQGILLKQEEITHAVSVHERCGTAMEIMVKPQWFIKILEKKQEIYDAGLKCNFYPKNTQKRFLNWVENLKWDWCISRQRRFGVPFPVWYCEKCGEIKLADIEQLPIDPTTTQPKSKCSCGHDIFRGETDIMDTWATSSLTPQIGCDLITKKGLDDSHIPMSLRPNAHDNIRVWDFYTIAMSLLHFNKLPWENVMISGWGLSATGEKLSKSKSNGGTLTPFDAYSKYSADVTRYWASNASLGKDVFITEDEFKNGFKLMQKIWNAGRFALSFLEDYVEEQAPLLPLDEWIINYAISTQTEFKKALDIYEMGQALNAAERLFWTFCDFYIELVKNRLYKPEIYGEAAKKSAQFALSKVLKAILKMFSLYMPHVTEEIYQDYFAKQENKKSIHIAGFETFDFALNEQVIKNGSQVCDILSEIRGYKSRMGQSIKEEIPTIVVYNASDFTKACEKDILAAGNVISIEYKQDDSNELRVIIK